MEGTTLYCGDNCNHTGPHRYPPATTSVDPRPRAVIYAVVPLNAMRCPVCGHRLDDMDGCDSCAADREAALIDGITEEGDDCG